MRALFALVVLAACGPAVPPPLSAQPGAPRLQPPPLIDPARPGAAYLNSIALQLQPGWGQFLDDCRLRLPATHALNAMALSASAQLVIDRRGKLVETSLVRSSGNADFDRAVRDAMADATATAFNPPPLELVSDDDRVHLRWLFARDRRQAGPATAELVRIELPIAGVTARLVAEGDLARAARRVAIAPPSAETAAATERVMIAALREALVSNDTSARRAAVAAIARAKVTDLARDVRALIVDTSDTEALVGAIVAAGDLGDRDAADVLLRLLERDFAPASSPGQRASMRPRIAQAELRALVALGLRDRAAAVLHAALAGVQRPSPLAIEALALAPSADLEPQLAGWLAHGDVHTRGAVCIALAGMPARAERMIVRGLGDADASVRARCVETAGELVKREPKLATQFGLLTMKLVLDRDRDVRASAVTANARIVGVVPDMANDTAAEVRAAYARALVLAVARGNDHRPSAMAPAEVAAKLRALADDREIEVRAAAWNGLAELPPPPDAAFVAHGAADAAPEVRAAAIAALSDEALLDKLAAGDDAPEARTAALVRLARLRGRAHITERLLDRLATASPNSADRARIALAWLLAP